MPGLVPGIHVSNRRRGKDVDGRDIGAKTRFALLPGHDDRWMSAVPAATPEVCAGTKSGYAIGATVQMRDGGAHAHSI